MSADHPRARIDIDAPLEVVWSVMLDVERYGEWNPFIHRVECRVPPTQGDPIRLHVRFGSGKEVVSPERVTQIRPPYDDSGTTRAVLTYVYQGLPARLGLVRGTRFQHLAQQDGGPTSYDTWEEFSGPLVRLAGPGRVADGFRRHAEALRERAETLASGQRR